MEHEADRTRAQIQEAIDKAESATSLVSNQLNNRTTDVTALISRLIQAIRGLSLEQMNMHQFTHESRNAAQAALAGTEGNAEEIGFLGQVLTNSEDDVKKLQRIIEVIESTVHPILQSYATSNEESAGKLRSAIGYLNGRMNAL